MTAPASLSGRPSQPLDRPGEAQNAFSRPRLLLAFLAYLVVTGGFLAAILALLREDALRSGAALGRSFAQVIEEQTARTVQSVEHLLGQAQRELRVPQAPGAATEAGMRAVFRELLADLPYVRAVWFLDKDGVIRFDSDEGNVGIALADRPYFAQYRQNPALGLRLNDPIRSRSTGTWFIPVTRPVYDDGGALAGIVVASLEPGYLDRVWSASDTDDRFAVVFLRRDGTVLMRSPFLPELMGKSFATRDLFRLYLPERLDGTLVDAGLIDPQARLFAFRVLRAYPDLVVVVSRTIDRVLADWWRFASLTIGGWLAASAALSLIAALLIRESWRRRSVETNLRRLASERAAVIDALPAHIALLDSQGTIVAVNAAWRRFGRSQLADGERGGVGDNYLAVCDGALGDRSEQAAEVATGLRAVLEGRTTAFVLEYPCHAPAERRWFRLMVAPLPDHGAPGAVVMHVDITDRKQDDQLHAAESQVLEMISTGAALPAVLDKVTMLVEAILPSTTASIVLLDRATGRLRHGAAPHLPAAYAAAIVGLPIGPNAGSCGTAMYRGEQVITDDIEHDALWENYCGLVRPYGFRSCWSTPILTTDRQVLASLALYFEQSKTPTDADQRLIDRAVHLVRIAIEHSLKDEELRASALSLRDSERRFQALANATFDAIWDRDVKADTIWWSEGFRTVFGFTEEEMARRSQSWRQRVHPDDLARVLGSVEEAMGRKETTWQEDYRFFDQAGRMLHVSDRARIIYDDRGEPSRVIGGMTDVTLMHEARQRIEELQNSLRTLIDAAKVGILVHRDDKPLLVNDELARMFGYASPAEMLALPDCRVLFAPEEIQRLSAYNLARRRGEDAPGFYAVKGSKKDGTRIELENRAFTIPWEGEVAVCAMLVDVTARLALEEQLRQAQRLEAVGQLTGGVAHDFNNLLQVILGNAEHLERNLEGDETLRQMAELTRVAAERGATLTNQLLAFSRRQTLAPKVTDVGAAIAGMSALLRRTLGEQVTVSVVQHAELWWAFIDAPQFESAVLNLGINARDAMPGGGQLTIELDNMVIDSAFAQQAGDVEPGDYVLVAISDTGEGMTPDVLARVFEPFFTTKEVGKGSGLGLSMVLGFIKQSKGHVKIYSEPGQGTTVKLYLPRAASGAAGLAPKGEEGPLPRGTERILLVEDDDLVRTHAAALLKSLGYNVTTAAHGHEALDRLRGGQRFDLLFTDVVMPGGINGRQLADQAMDIQPGLPVLFTSGYTDTTVIQHGHLEPGAHMIAKPYRRQDLAQKLRDVLARGALAV